MATFLQGSNNTSLVSNQEKYRTETRSCNPVAAEDISGTYSEKPETERILR